MLAAVVQTVAVVGLIACAVLARRGWRRRGMVAASFMLLVLSDMTLLAVLVMQRRSTPSISVPKRP